MRGGEEGKGGERKGREEGGRGDNVEAQGQGRKGMRREKRGYHSIQTCSQAHADPVTLAI